MNNTDRVLRGSLGLVLIVVAIWLPAMGDYPMMALLTGAFGAANVFSGIFGFCFAYRLAGISSCRKQDNPSDVEDGADSELAGSPHAPISQLRLSVMLACAGLIVIALFAWGVQNGVVRAKKAQRGKVRAPESGIHRPPLSRSLDKEGLGLKS